MTDQGSLCCFYSISFFLQISTHYADYSGENKNRRVLCCKNRKYPFYISKKKRFTPKITNPVKVELICMQEKATKNQKHVMLFWESKLIHKLRGKSKISNFLQLSFFVSMCTWLILRRYRYFHGEAAFSCNGHGYVGSQS